ncbi:MAG: archaeosortase/exosortase family protein [Lentisphaerales bacterium]|nr:archaeosortase/exosortase family protein [Lentisphaerales bacterium]
MKKHSIAFLFVLYYLPAFNWILNGWATSPLDKFSYLFAGLAMLLLTLRFYKNRASSQLSIKVLNILLAIYLMVEIAAFSPDINIMRSTNLIYFVATIIYAKFGKQQTITCIPLLVILFLSLPTVSFMINRLLSPFTATNINTAFITKLTLSTALILC